MKRILSLLAIAVLAAASVFAQYVPTEENEKAREVFQDNKFGIFIHWGIYSMMARGEWVQSVENLNAAEYAHLADGFYPSKFNADEWVKTIKEAGARYICITSRHHDGFSMFGTKASNYNIVDATPFKRDILKELADACQRNGIKLHFYYSHLDWHRLDYPICDGGQTYGRPTDKQDFTSYLAFMKQQLTELLTGYGPIGAIWFDGVWDHDRDAKPFDWHLQEQYELIHSLQPSCLVANNHHKAIVPGEDIQVFEQDLPGENNGGFSGGQTIGHLPLETCLTMNNTWGYDIRDKSYKSLDYLIHNLVKAAGKNGNLLLNVGPRPDGQLPVEAVGLMKGIGEWLSANGETIYGTRAGIVAPHDWGVTTQRGNKLYVHILKGQEPVLYLPLDIKKVKSAVMFADKSKVGYSRCGEGLTLTLAERPKGVDTIVEITLK